MLDKPKSAIVVTGVSSGIGESIARHMMDEGYTVFGSVRKQADAEELQQKYASAFQPMLFDVRDRESIRSAASNAKSMMEQNEQRLVALVNNAGLAIFGPMECLNDQEFEEIVAINLFGTRNVTNAFLPLLRSEHNRLDRLSEKRKKAGIIVNISSLSGILNTPMNGAYCVSKHAMESIGEIYRRELYASGIDVCSIRSGPIQSEIWNKNIDNNIAYEDADYTLMSANAQSIMRTAANKAQPASVIAKLVQDIVERRKRRVAYAIGSGSLVARILSSFVPVRLADRLISRALLKPHT